MDTLQVYITAECWTCDESQRLAVEIATQFPALKVEILDLNRVERPSTVFAVPTYLFNGRLLFLGNPTYEQLQTTLRQATQSPTYNDE